MVKPVKLAHVVHMTRRFDEMIAWYRNVFEAEVVYENSEMLVTPVSAMATRSSASIS